jgi:hypothetical protein
MRRVAGLLVFVLCSVIFVAAQDKDKDNAAGMDKGKAGGMEMTGVLCNKKCVKQDAGKASCDSSCTETHGDVVFIDDEGKSYKVGNQKMAKSHAGKKVKMTGKMKGEMMMPEQIVDLGLGGG